MFLPANSNGSLWGVRVSCFVCWGRPWAAFAAAGRAAFFLGCRVRRLFAALGSAFVLRCVASLCPCVVTVWVRPALQAHGCGLVDRVVIRPRPKRKSCIHICIYIHIV